MAYRNFTEDDKDFIRMHYKGDRASVEFIAGRIGHPVSSVKGQVYKLGLGRRIKHHHWTPEEEERLADLITREHINKVAGILKLSVNSVAVKLQRMHLSRRIRDGYFTQKEVAQLFGVDHHWVSDRIKSGELKAEPIMGYIPKQGGSRLKIKEQDIKKFIIDNAVKLTGRNVDISMLVYILTGE